MRPIDDYLIPAAWYRHASRLAAGIPHVTTPYARDRAVRAELRKRVHKQWRIALVAEALFLCMRPEIARVRLVVTSEMPR